MLKGRFCRLSVRNLYKNLLSFSICKFWFWPFCAFYFSPSRINSSFDSTRIDDEHRLIARYAARLAADANNAVSVLLFILSHLTFFYRQLWWLCFFLDIKIIFFLLYHCDTESCLSVFLLFFFHAKLNAFDLTIENAFSITRCISGYCSDQTTLTDNSAKCQLINMEWLLDCGYRIWVCSKIYDKQPPFAVLLLLIYAVVARINYCCVSELWVRVCCSDCPAIEGKKNKRLGVAVWIVCTAVQSCFIFTQIFGVY